MSSPTLFRRRPSTRQGRPADRSTAGPGPGPATVSPGRSAARFRYDPRSRAWWWSPEMLALHGLEPGNSEPCPEVLFDRHQPDDRVRAVEAFTRAATVGQAVAVQSRIVGASGEQRTVVLVGEPELEPDGAVGAVRGLCIDVTDSVPRSAVAERVEALEREVEQLRSAMASRATIEQAKGILMLLSCCSEQVAFDLLAHISSHTHRKVREVAQSIADSASGLTPLPADVCAIIRDACPPTPTGP